jgi:hypothetical protein
LVSAAGATGSDLTSPEFTDQLLAAIEHGLDVEEYLAGRSGGVAHNELIDAKSEGIQLPYFIAARMAGASGAEISEIVVLDEAVLGAYASFRRAGFLHGDAVEAIAIHTSVGVYFAARRFGSTHEEALDADRLCLPRGAYVVARGEGLTHAELVSAHQSGISIDDYRVSRRSLGRIL